MQTQTLEEIIKILPKGLMTIPKKFREKLGLKDNSLVKVSMVKDKLTLEPISVVPYAVRQYNDDDLREFFELDKRETKTLKKLRPRT